MKYGGGCHLRGRLVEVVIVDVQLGIRVGLSRGLESNADEVLAKNTGEDRIAKGAILVEDFVHDVLLGS